MCRDVFSGPTGLRQVFVGLNPERITGAAAVIGAGRRAVAKAVAYANERVVWSQPIGAHQVSLARHERCRSNFQALVGEE